MSHDYFIVYRRPKNKKSLFDLLKNKKQNKIIPLIKKERGARYSTRFRRAKTDDSKALILAEEMTHCKHIKVTRKRIPTALKKQVEHDLKAKLKLKPKLYVFEPKKGYSFVNRLELSQELGIAHMPVTVTHDDELGEIHTPEDPYILLPKSHYKDKTIADTVTLHELAETLAMQEINNLIAMHVLLK
jgi:hypothetical protein